MRVFDASSMIYAWDNYPERQFPGLWEWMAKQVAEGNLAMPSVAFDEVKGKSPHCGHWLTNKNLKLLEITNSILLEALRIKRLLGIVEQYHAKGVGENDLLIIATAKIHNVALVSDEEKQLNLPQLPSKRKIPAVCFMSEVAVPCLSFLEFIKGSGEVFR